MAGRRPFIIAFLKPKDQCTQRPCTQIITYNMVCLCLKHFVIKSPLSIVGCTNFAFTLFLVRGRLVGGLKEREREWKYPIPFDVVYPNEKMASIGTSLKRKRNWDCIRRKMRLHNLNRMIRESDTLCRNYLRINQYTFGVLLEMVRDIGRLNETRNTCLEEMVAAFLYTLAHHKKNRMMGAHFYRSGETISRQFHACLLAILKLHAILLKKPTPIQEDCNDERWKYFKNSLGALDGTMILVNVPCDDRSKYRTRKGTLAMNVLGVCSPEMEFIYVLPGWEGSAHDGRILRDAIPRPNGLKVPKGFYYLCDGGYTNGEGFLAPYRGYLYRLREWNNGPRQPQIAEEYFNLRHAKAINVIERCFGLLKRRWGILRSPSWFSLQTHGRIVLACALLHNLVKRYMLAEFDDEDLFEENDSDDNDGLDNADLLCDVIHFYLKPPFLVFELQTCMFISCIEYLLRMDESSASGGGRGKNKRFWTAQEDKALVEALSELAVDPHWRCENGFRSSYMVRLEELIGKALPGCGLKALPHIDSRLKTLVAKFRAISQMLNTSGFVWNDEKKNDFCISGCL
ncbi:uncharacterized protein LOC130808954 [Amaranthus tricolor]|uniref:uncharacterized protein LOC130808954 n=1 Tax=Amaranthus tricolor TaxID=29722 RepID=UPI00258D1EF7|nr:uncharacterized protein LOC130808954 [Amaranthus tricolor]